MNNTIKLAVASALLAAASTASAGILIPAGDWTVDLGGNMNAFITDTKSKTDGVKNPTSNTIGTGLLPSAISIGAKTRQNDLDVSFNFAFWTGTSSGNNAIDGGAAGNNSLNIRQAYLTFGDASWGSITAGRNLGIYGSDAILSDMTLLGVGVGGPAGGSSTLGRIGSGYIYADWKGQVSYASPNFNGFSFTGGVMENFRPAGTVGAPGASYGDADVTTASTKDMAFEGKVAYDLAAGDITGRAWASAISQKTKSIDGLTAYTSSGFDVGAKASAAGFGIVGYYYDGRGLDGQNVLGGLFNASGEKTNDKGGYVQGTFTVPGAGTKLGVSYGENNSRSEVAGDFSYKNESWMVGAYHPLTKHLNLVAEYVDQKKTEKVADTQTKTKTMSLGAILFF